MAGMAAVEPLREQDLDRLADELARVVAEHLLDVVVRGRDPAVLVDDDDAVGRGP